jgi:hypothetical protein
MKLGAEENITMNHTKIPSMPNLVRNEALAALMALVIACVISAVFDAPVDGPADATGIPAQTVKAPWIFLGIQQLLRYLPTAIAGIVLPLTAWTVLASIPWMPSHKRGFTAALFFGIVFVSGVLTLWGQIR